MYPADSLFWFDAENVVFREGGPQSMRGDEKIIDVDATALEQAFVDGRRRIYMAEGAEVKMFEEAAVSNPTTLVSKTASFGDWSLATFGSWLVGTNGIDKPFLWKNGTVVDLPIPGNTCKALLQFGPYIVALGIDDEPRRIAWSDEDDPENWSLTDTEASSGDLNLRDLDSEIMGFAAQGNQIGIYSRDSFGLLTAIGQPFIFGFDKRLDGIGSVSLDAVVAVGQRNFGLSRQGVWTSDGVQIDYIDDPEIQGFIQDNVNWDLAHKVKAFHNELERQVIWSFPSGNSVTNDKAVGFKYTTGAWTKYSFGFRAAMPRAVFQYPITSRDRSVWFTGKKEESDHQAWAETAPLDMGEVDRIKRIQAVRLGFRGSGTVKFQAREKPDDTPEVYHSQATESYIPLVDRETPFFSMRFEGTNWKLSSIIAKGELAGEAI